MKISDLLHLLPSVAAPEGMHLSANDALTYRTEGIDAFVEPTLSEKESDDLPSRVLIVSAAGAVGKTTFARELAFRSQCPFWDLAAEGPVAKHSLVGALVKYFGAPALAQLSAGWQSGSFCIVVDALDEARVKAGGEMQFESFINDLGQFAKQATGIAFVLFGRTQIAEHTWLLLNDAGIPSTLLEIENFDRPQAEEYVDKKIQSTGRWELVQQFRQPFEQARDVIFDCLDRAITGVGETPNGERVASHFLGYAPVLDAIAVLLARTGNFEELRSSIALDVQQGRFDQPMKLLRRIVEDILRRESENKLQKQIKAPLEALAAKTGWAKWSLLYREEEQIARVMGVISNRRVDIELPIDMSGELRSKYEEQVASWLSEHPFLRDGKKPANAVFESYLLASALLKGNLPGSASSLHGATARSAAEGYLDSSSYKATRLLADFYILFLADSGGDLIRPEHIGFVYEAAAAAETEKLKVRFSLESNYVLGDPRSSTDIATGEIEFLYRSEKDASVCLENLSFDTTISANSVIKFKHSLRDAVIVAPCEVCFGGSADDFLLGPDVTVQCRLLRLASSRLTVETQSRHEQGEIGSVVLEAEEFPSAYLERPTVRGGGSFGVNWPGAEQFPWHEFRIKEFPPTMRDERLRVLYRRFRRIVMTLRSHSKGALARYRDKVEHQRILKGAIGTALLEKMVKDGILARDTRFYYWQPRVADQLVGIHWGDLKLGACPPQLSDYLETFANQDDAVQNS